LLRAERRRRGEMAVQTTVVGSYPKPPPEGGDFHLRKTLHALEKDGATSDDLTRAQDELVREVIAEQEGAGIDLITDGQVRWEDIVTPFARHMVGFEIGGLLRFFDNNVYYRRPVCTGEIDWRGPCSVDAFQFAAAAASAADVKAVIPGPVTFARLSVDNYYGDHEAFVTAIAHVLAQEAFELEAAGAREIQIDEPALLAAPEDLELAHRSIATITRELENAKTTLATYFGDAKRLGTDIFNLPVHAVGFDLVAGPENNEILASAPDTMGIQAGVVDARNTMLENLEDLSRQIRSLVDRLGEDRLRVSPSAGLEFLPREKARSKLARLAEAARKAGEG
jgi:5-methyltetrahydropteroyltriglutamate--homocysteine methyltransferase